MCVCAHKWGRCIIINCIIDYRRIVVIIGNFVALREKSFLPERREKVSFSVFGKRDRKKERGGVYTLLTTL